MTAMQGFLNRLAKAFPIWKEIKNYLDTQNSGFDPAMIRGTWYYYDPLAGDNANDGLDKETPLKDFEAAYAKCKSGAGDGIVALSAGTTSAQTTSYLKKTLTWDKHGITVVGISSKSRMFGRARIASKEVTTGSLTDLSFLATPKTITRVAGSFIDDGFVVGQAVTINTTSNSANEISTVITALTDKVMTVSGTLIDENAATAGATTIISYNAAMIIVSGDNNAFHNVHVGNFGSLAGAVGGIKVTGNRNFFDRCHVIGAGAAAPAATTGAYDLEDNGQENTYERCTFGTDTIIRAAANGNIRFGGGAWRARFYDCDIVSYSATAGKGAILSAGADACSGIIVFARCRFMNWTPNGITNLASAFIGTKITSGQLLMDSCSLIGWTVWDSVGGNDNVYVANSAAVASGAGGISTAP